MGDPDSELAHRKDMEICFRCAEFVAYSGTRLSNYDASESMVLAGDPTGLLSWLRRWRKYRCSRNCCTRITPPCSVKPMMTRQKTRHDKRCADSTSCSIARPGRLPLLDPPRFRARTRQPYRRFVGWGPRSMGTGRRARPEHRKLPRCPSETRAERPGGLRRGQPRQPHS